jgi:hypothetical protein
MFFNKKFALLPTKVPKELLILKNVFINLGGRKFFRRKKNE